jgi:hypothetical protein
MTPSGPLLSDGDGVLWNQFRTEEYSNQEPAIASFEAVRFHSQSHKKHVITSMK